MAFVPPSSTVNESVKVADLNGHLLIIEPTEFKTGIQTVHGDADAIEVRINDLDTNQNYESVLFFNVALKSALKSKIGQKVLARIGQGTAQKGKSAPWILIDATQDAEAVAKANAFIGNAGKATPAPAATPTAVDANNLSPEVQALLNQLGATQVK